MINFLDINYDKFASHYQKDLIVKESHKYFGEMYLGGKKTTVSDDVFIVTSIGTDFHMDADVFEGLLYNNLS